MKGKKKKRYILHSQATLLGTTMQSSATCSATYIVKFSDICSLNCWGCSLRWWYWIMKYSSIPLHTATSIVHIQLNKYTFLWRQNLCKNCCVGLHLIIMVCLIKWPLSEDVMDVFFSPFGILLHPSGHNKNPLLQLNNGFSMTVSNMDIGVVLWRWVAATVLYDIQSEEMMAALFVFWYNTAVLLSVSYWE